MSCLILVKNLWVLLPSNKTNVLQLNNAEGSLQSILECLPQLGQRCEEFLRSSADINAHRRLNSLTLTRNAQILEVSLKCISEKQEPAEKHISNQKKT